MQLPKLTLSTDDGRVLAGIDQDAGLVVELGDLLGVSAVGQVGESLVATGTERVNHCRAVIIGLLCKRGF